ncbi:MAG TPA: gliding motility-associated C-terminal domain-containing protein, partial [Bacteroidia bacterium]
INPTAPKTYYVTPINQYGCAGPKDSVIVLLGDTINATVTSEFGIICSGQNNVLTAYPQNPPILPNTTPYTYSWGVLAGGGTANIVSTSVSGDAILVDPTANVIYTVTVHGVCVKRNIAQVSVQVNNCVKPKVFFTKSADTICVNHCITFKDSTQYLSLKPLYYTWVFPGGTIFPYPASTVTPPCTLSFSSLTNNPVKAIKVCYHINSLLNQNPRDGVYGYYPVIEIVRNGIGQVDSLIDSVRVNPGPIANAGNNQTIDQGNSTTICATASTLDGPTTYNWAAADSGYIKSPGSPCTVVTPSTTTQYTLTLTDKYGCMDTASVTIIVDVICKDIFVATAFSPNGDGMNDVLHVKSNCTLTNLSFKIFDRWGEKVFESTEENFGWDGYYKAKLMDSGVFMYTVDGFLSNGKEVKKKGNVTLLR